jgi:Putative peptidoglycan binding domain
VITGAHKRSRSLVAATVAALACAAGYPLAVATAANPGGTAPSSASTPITPAPATVGHASAVVISDARCVPVGNCSANHHQVSTHGRLLMLGKGLKAGMVVAFPRTPGAHISRLSPTAHLHNSALGLVIGVPSNAHSGHILVMLSHGRHSNSFGPITVVRYALHPPRPKPTALTPTGAVPVSSAASSTAFDGQGMWIWYISQSNGGNLASIVARAHAAGVSTVFVKSSDGSTNYWSQFSSELVAQMHANGIKVCAWQYVYGTNPVGEANLGAQAVTAGADCLVIDAESQYEGRYGAAQKYITALRAKVGESYPVGLASFPYVSYHPTFPYSVFMGPGGAQYNAPQMYWKDIGVSVDTIYANTYIANRIYGRPIFPLGQTYSHPSSSDLVRFREEATDYGATGLSWWDWQETPESGWEALSAPLVPLTSVTPNTAYPHFTSGQKGDQVLWLQEHLASAISVQSTGGTFDSQTVSNLKQFQSAHGIPASGETDSATWAALLALAPVPVDWTGEGP